VWLQSLLFSNAPVLSVAEGIKEGVITILEGLFEVIWGSLGWVVISSIEALLFFRPPTDIPQLVSMYWGITFPLFWVILGVTSAWYFLGIQLFPTSSKADLERYTKRFFIAVVMVIVVGYGFGFAVEATNAIMDYLYPDQYRFRVDIDTFQGLATVGVSGFATLIFAVVASPKIIFTYGMFLLALGMRMLIVYTVYAIFPVLISMWVVDIGPATYLKMLSGFIMKAGVFLLMFGIVLSSILGVGGALVGDQPTPTLSSGDVENFDISSYNDRAETRTAGGVFSNNPPQLQSSAPKGTTSSWLRVYTFFGAIWICIALTLGVLGSSINTGFSAALGKVAASKGLRGRVKGRKNKSGSDSPSSAGGGAAGGEVNRYGGDSSGSSHKTRGQDAAPELDNSEGVSLGEKADNISGGRLSSAREAGANAKGRAEQKADQVASKASEAGDKIEQGTTELGEKVGGAGGDYGAAAGRAGGKAVGKGLNYGVTGAGYAVKGSMKGMNLAKRGGKAYTSVFKQPDVGSSLGEMGRIARESPIGDPGPQKKDESGSKSSKGGMQADQVMHNDEDDEDEE
jgi:hypothetical protein